VLRVCTGSDFAYKVDNAKGWKRKKVCAWMTSNREEYEDVAAVQVLSFKEYIYSYYNFVQSRLNKI